MKASKRYLKGPTGYLVLRNPHSICYINSFLQQIFHIKEFKKGIFETRWKENEIKEEDLIYQIKKIFINLEEKESDLYFNH